MKIFKATLGLNLIFSLTSVFAQAELTNVREQKVEIQSVECLSSFGNLFCSGDYTCRQAAMENAHSSNCKIDIKKIESKRHEDYISGGTAYRSYSCSILAESDCGQELTSR